MKKLGQKIISCLAAVVMLVGCGFILTACGKNNDPDKVMNISMNPSIELVLDGNNKVLSVNAINDEGNFIIANASFTGLSAEDAVDLFIKTTEENGFVDTTLAAEDNKLEIEISGDDAQKLYDKVKKSADKYLQSLNLNVTVTLEKLSKENLEKLVDECMQELSESEIKGKTEEELLALIKESREETKNLMNQELKQLYYNERADEIIKEKFQSIKTQLDALTTNLGVAGEIAKTTFNSAYTTLTDKLEELNTKYAETFLDDDSDYQKAVAKFMEEKKKLLEARVNEDDENLTSLKAAVSTAETALTTARTAATNAINLVRNTMLTAVTTLETALTTINAHINADTVNNAVNNAKAEFKANFETTYATYINDDYWKNGLKPTTNA